MEIYTRKHVNWKEKPWGIAGKLIREPRLLSTARSPRALAPSPKFNECILERSTLQNPLIWMIWYQFERAESLGKRMEGMQA